MTEQASSTSKPRQPVTRPAPKKAGRGSRFLVAGAAVGLSVAAVGGMAAAAQAGDSQPAPGAPVQRVVLPQQAPLPQQIVIVLPDANLTGSGQVVTPEAIQIVPPARASTVDSKQTTPVKTEAPAPVTESGGS